MLSNTIPAIPVAHWKKCVTNSSAKPVDEFNTANKTPLQKCAIKEVKKAVATILLICMDTTDNAGLLLIPPSPSKCDAEGANLSSVSKDRDWQISLLET